MARSRRPLKLEPPRERRWPWPAIAASVAVHSLLLFGWVSGRLPMFPPRPAQLVVLTPPPAGPRAVELPFKEAPPDVGAPAPPSRRPRKLPDRPAVPQIAVPRLESPPADSGLVRAPTATAREPIGRIGPGLGDGLL
ncbi:MAG: hypothetical protein ACRDH5_05185, partial [bacterium]